MGITQIGPDDKQPSYSIYDMKPLIGIYGWAIADRYIFASIYEIILTIIFNSCGEKKLMRGLFE